MRDEFKHKLGSYTNENGGLPIGAFMSNLNDEKKVEQVLLPNINKDDYMFHANNIFSSYYWCEKNAFPIALLIDVAFDDNVIEEFDKKLTNEQIVFDLI